MRPTCAALALMLACGSGEEAPPRTEPGPPPGAARPAEPDTKPALAPGEVEVAFGVDGIVARANQAPRRAVLEELAGATGLLTVSFGARGDPDGRVTFESAGEPIEVVLARALAGVPYAIEPLADEGRARLALVVGERAAEPAPPERRGNVRRVLDPRQRDERARQLAEMESEALDKLESSDPRERALGVEWADTTTVAGYEAVIERLANDPDAAVRAAAAESLASADVGAVRPLLGALADPDARVVLAALESLEMLGDASIVPDLTPALDHPDPAVRERAREAEDFLR